MYLFDNILPLSMRPSLGLVVRKDHVSALDRAVATRFFESPPAELFLTSWSERILCTAQENRM